MNIDEQIREEADHVIWYGVGYKCTEKCEADCEHAPDCPLKTPDDCSKCKCISGCNL